MKQNYPKCGFEMRLSKNKDWWYCPANTKDEFHKSFVKVGEELKTPSKDAVEFQKAGDIADKRFSKDEIEDVKLNEKLDFEILLMEELGAIQDSLEKIMKALQAKAKQ